MSKGYVAFSIGLSSFLALSPLARTETAPPPSTTDNAKLTAELAIDPGHPWRPPFGLQRVGQPQVVVGAIWSDAKASRFFEAVGYAGKNEVERHHLVPSPWQEAAGSNLGTYKKPIRAEFSSHPDRIALVARVDADGAPSTLAEVQITYPDWEAEAVAVAETPAHPVDLGAIFVPETWPVLVPGQKSIVRVAMISNDRDRPGCRLRVGFKSDSKVHEERLDVSRRVLATREIRLSAPLASSDKQSDKEDEVRISVIDAAGAEIWRKALPVMLVSKKIDLPRFGATKLKLRYDLPVIVNTTGTGKLDMKTIQKLDYDKAWDPKFQDVVISFPSGARFVFWRGSGLVPFWAGPHNTGLCYEWMEGALPPGGKIDGIEALNDKELRYSHVEIIESTPARVHARWTYQPTDFVHQVWGDQAVEDYYFYPDGFGTRAMTMKKRPKTTFEVSEFLILSAAGMHPLDFVPLNAVEMIFMTGDRYTFHFPSEEHTAMYSPFNRPDRKGPMVFRVRSHRDDRQTSVLFHPGADSFPTHVFGAQHDQGQRVTAAYWGSHWPLTRGKATGPHEINPLIDMAPSHTSLMSWTRSGPEPDSRVVATTTDALGQLKKMDVLTYTWMIGMTDEPDDRLIGRAKSFTKAPSLELAGAALDSEAYVPARRAMRLQVQAKNVSIVMKPVEITVNPVFELLSAPRTMKKIKLGGKPLPKERYAWDGHTLWIEATLRSPESLEIEFD